MLCLSSYKNTFSNFGPFLFDKLCAQNWKRSNLLLNTDLRNKNLSIVLSVVRHSRTVSTSAAVLKTRSAAAESGRVVVLFVYTRATSAQSSAMSE